LCHDHAPGFVVFPGGYTLSEIAQIARDSDNSDLTTAGRQIVEEFDALPDEEKREVLVNLIKIYREIEYPVATDAELLTIADSLFLEYDRRESEE
jgi:hypothetical protein